jgi:hypothetical protein
MSVVWEMPCRAIQCWGVQVSLKWLTQQRIPVIPKTDTKQHLLENTDLFGWELSVDEMATLTRATSPPVMSDDRRAKSGARSRPGFVYAMSQLACRCRRTVGRRCDRTPQSPVATARSPEMFRKPVPSPGAHSASESRLRCGEPLPLQLAGLPCTVRGPAVHACPPNRLQGLRVLERTARSAAERQSVTQLDHLTILL